PAAGSFTENFDSTWSRRWTVFGGNWTARNGVLSTVPASANGARALAMATAFTNFTYEADVSVGSVGNAGLVFRASKPDIGADAYCGYYVGINAAGSDVEFGYANNGWHSITNVAMTIAANTTYHLKVQAQGSRLRIYVNNTNQPVIDVRDGNYSSGMVGVRDYCTDGNQSLSSFAQPVAHELPAPPAGGPHAWYQLEGGALDASGYGNDGVLHGNVSFVTGKLGAQAAQFDGTTSSYVTIPLSVSNSFTIAFWVKTTAAGGSGQWYNGKGLVDGEMPGAVNDFGTALVGNYAAFGVGNPDTTILSTNVINDGAWHHVTATRDSVSGQMNLYLDGILQATASGPTGTRAAPPNLRLGSLQTGVTGGFLSGTIDDVQLFDRAFSAGEVPALMNHAPQLSPVPDAAILAGRTLLVTNTATDADAPAQTLAFSLPNPPSGAAVNPVSGLITWRPSVAQSGTTYPLTVQVADTGTPSLSATQNFAVTVLPPARPALQVPASGNGLFSLQINGDVGPDYLVYATTNLAVNMAGWVCLLMTNPATLPFQFVDSAPPDHGQKFYRVALGP
ncbi:MAG TPA: LamG-like jellyroll fold domain-containing protein, partial [Candidatus Acidoferrales bacterium]|nr:LamG-like jellyroll fold domain-containing protein [Candidatus Acidoferrales bacterium]